MLPIRRWQLLGIVLLLVAGCVLCFWDGLPHFLGAALIGVALVVGGYWGGQWIVGVTAQRQWLLRLEALRASLAYLPHVEANLNRALWQIGQPVGAVVVAWLSGDTESDNDVRVVGPGHWPKLHRMVAAARSEGDVQVLEDTERSDDASLRAAGLRAAVAVPVPIEGNIVGVLAVGWRQPRCLTRAEMRFLSAAAGSWAVALENVRICGRLKDEGRERERERIARELHDGLAQTLTLVKLRADAALAVPRTRGNPHQVLEALEETRQMVMHAASDLRGVIHDLRRNSAQAGDWLQELSTSVTAWSAQAGIQVHLDLPQDLPPLSVDGQIQVLSIVQEALTNVRKHSGARGVTVCVARESVGVVVSVADDGRGFDPNGPSAPEHFGLRILHERARAVDGILQVITSPGQGTEVRLVLPDRSVHTPEEDRLVLPSSAGDLITARLGL